MMLLFIPTISVLSVISFAEVYLGYQWNQIVSRQIKLDHTVQYIIPNLTTLDQKMIALNVKIEILRIKIIALSIHPAMQTEILALKSFAFQCQLQQKSLVFFWKKQSRLYSAAIWPPFPWLFLSHDAFGTVAAQRKSNFSRLEVSDEKLSSAAKLFHENSKVPLRAKWQYPIHDEFYRTNIF